MPPNENAVFEQLYSCRAGKHQAFSYDGAGSNYVFVNIYDEDANTNPLEEDGTGIVDITGSEGEEDDVIQSAHTVTWVSCKLSPRKEGSSVKDEMQSICLQVLTAWGIVYP